MSDAPAEGPSAHVSPYDRLSWPPPLLEDLLRRGVEERELRAYFGDVAYAELATLARSIDPGAVRSDHRVYVLPGIMGSQLGLPREPPLPADLLWFDPIDLSGGRILALRMVPGSAVRALGVVLYDYMRLFLRLRAAGFDALLYDYDWRFGIDRLGLTFARAIEAEPAAHISIVAHSMGGLVARAALRFPGGARVRRLVTLGTPHGGSFAPVQAFRGTYPLVRRIASLDPLHTAEVLAARVFSGFPSLYHLLPQRGVGCELDLFDPAAWPGTGPGPDAALLAASRRFQGTLPRADARLRVIAASGEPTVTGIEREGDEFRYHSSGAGDGTVPVAFAQIEGVATGYVSGVRHGDLARNDTVIEAVCELIDTGRSARLASAPAAGTVGPSSITDAELRRTLLTKIDWGRLTPQARADFVENLSAPAERPPPG
jgi:hypothetical protein